MGNRVALDASYNDGVTAAATDSDLERLVILAVSLASVAPVQVKPRTAVAVRPEADKSAFKRSEHEVVPSTEQRSRWRIVLASAGCQTDKCHQASVEAAVLRILREHQRLKFLERTRALLAGASQPHKVLVALQ
jgi:hypothetical protein